MRIIGFVNMNRAVLSVVKTKWDTRGYPYRGEPSQWVSTTGAWSDDGLAAWLVKTSVTGKYPILVLEDSAHWLSFREQAAPYGIVFASAEWLDRHGVPALDIEREGEHQRMLTNKITPEYICQRLSAATSHELASWDRWMLRDRTLTVCAGCAQLQACKQAVSGDRCADYVAVKTEEALWFQAFGLGQLLHLCLNGCKESLLLLEPSVIWEATFRFAIGKEKRERWIQDYGRAMFGAGVPKRTLQGLPAWVKTFGKTLADYASRKVLPRTHPPTVADVKYARRILLALTDSRKE